MTVYIHIGTHKTGTTSLQKSLSEHRNALRQASIEYPECPISPQRNAHHKLINSIARPEQLKEQAEFSSLIDTVRQNSANGDKVLLSAESAYRHLCEPGGDEFVGRLEEAFRGVCVVPVIVFRRQDEFARSLYAEWVKNWGEIATFPEFLEQKKSWFEYARNLERLRKVFPLTRVINYDFLKGPSLSRRFVASVLGIQMDFPHLRERESASDDIVLAASELNRRGMNKSVRSFIHWADNKCATTKTDPTADLLFASFEARRSFYEQFRLENQRLASLCSSADEFFKDREWDEMLFGIFPDEAVSSLLSEFLAEQRNGV